MGKEITACVFAYGFNLAKSKDWKYRKERGELLRYPQGIGLGLKISNTLIVRGHSRRVSMEVIWYEWPQDGIGMERMVVDMEPG